MGEPIRVQRVQTGVRMERRMLAVRKALAAYLEMGIGDLLAGITLAAFEGRSPFLASTLARIEQLNAVHRMDYGAEASHRMRDEEDDRACLTRSANATTIDVTHVAHGADPETSHTLCRHRQKRQCAPGRDALSKAGLVSPTSPSWNQVREWLSDLESTRVDLDKRSA